MAIREYVVSQVAAVICLIDGLVEGSLIEFVRHVEPHHFCGIWWICVVEAELCVAVGCCDVPYLVRVSYVCCLILCAPACLLQQPKFGAVIVLFALLTAMTCGLQLALPPTDMRDSLIAIGIFIVLAFVGTIVYFLLDEPWHAEEAVVDEWLEHLGG